MLSNTNPDRKSLRRAIRLVAAIAVILAGIGLYVLGAQPFAVELFPPPWDKLAHMMTFAVIGTATGLASGTRGWRLVLSCVAGAVVIGAMDEWHQMYLPGRSAGLDDLGADAAGGLLGSALLGMAYAAMRRWTRHH